MSKLESLGDRALSGRKNECPLGTKNLFTVSRKVSVVTDMVVVPCDLNDTVTMTCREMEFGPVCLNFRY
jgi:hypothetical protein